MAITMDFAKKYAHLIGNGNCKKVRLGEVVKKSQIPEEYKKKLIHSEDSFVKLFCKEYD